MKILKKFLFTVFVGALFITVPVFAIESDFEILPPGPLFNETNIAPGTQLTKTLTFKNNTSYVQDVRFRVINYNDSVSLFGGLSLGDKIYIEVKDGSTTLFARDTLTNFKDQEIQFNLPPGSKNLTFKAEFDELIDNDYQGSSVSFDLQFNATWEGGRATEAIPGTAPGGAVAGVNTQRTINRGGAVGAVPGGAGVPGNVAGGFLEAGNPPSNPEKPSPAGVSEKKPSGQPQGFWNRLGAAIGDILPPLCVDRISLLWLIIGIGIGTLTHYLLNKKWGRSAGGGAQMAFWGFLWSKCSFWWLIIGIIIGFFAREIYKQREKEKKKSK